MMNPSNYPPGVTGNEPQITGEDPEMGKFFAAAWKGRGRGQEVSVSPKFDAIEEVRGWLKANRFRKYVIKQHARPAGGGDDGFDYIERVGV